MDLLTLFAVVVTVAGTIWFWRRKSRGTSLLFRTVDALALGDGEEGDRLFAELNAELDRSRDLLGAAELLARVRAHGHALRLVERGLSLKPGHRRLTRLRALLLARLVDPDAVETLGGWVRAHPRDGEATLELAGLYLRLRRLDELTDLLVPTLEHDPDAMEAHSLLGRGSFYAGRLDDARRHLERARSLRDKRRRQVVPLYDTAMARGYDFSVAVEGMWKENEDLMLLEQIESGVALSPTAVLEPLETAADPVSKV